MPNIKGGKNYKKGKKGAGKITKTETPYADTSDLVYGLVKRKLGSNRIETECSDNQLRQVIIPGSFYNNRIKIFIGSIILVQIDSLNPTKGYILYKYDTFESQVLKAKNEFKFDLSESKNIFDNKKSYSGTDMQNDEANGNDNDSDNVDDNIDDDVVDKNLKEALGSNSERYTDNSHLIIDVL